MFGFSEREKYAKAFLDFLSHEVFGAPKATLLGIYPGLRQACDSNFKEGGSPIDAGTFAARAVVTDIIGKMDDARREKVLIEYNELDWDAFYVWHLNSRIRREEPPKSVDKLMQIIARAQCAILYAYKLGQIDTIAFDDFRRDVVGALEGLSEGERVTERLRSSIGHLGDELGMDLRKMMDPPT